LHHAVKPKTVYKQSYSQKSIAADKKCN